MMDMLGNQRITWVLAEELAIDEAAKELAEEEEDSEDEYVEGGSWENKGQ